MRVGQLKQPLPGPRGIPGSNHPLEELHLVGPSIYASFAHIAFTLHVATHTHMLQTQLTLSVGYPVFADDDHIK